MPFTDAAQCEAFFTSPLPIAATNALAMIGSTPGESQPTAVVILHGYRLEHGHERLRPRQLRLHGINIGLSGHACFFQAAAAACFPHVGGATTTVGVPIGA